MIEKQHTGSEIKEVWPAERTKRGWNSEWGGMG